MNRIIAIHRKADAPPVAKAVAPKGKEKKVKDTSSGVSPIRGQAPDACAVREEEPKKKKVLSLNQKKELRRSKSSRLKRKEAKRNRKMVKKCFDSLIFKELLTSDTRTTKKSIVKLIKKRFHTEVDYEFLEGYKDIWHPKYYEQNVIKYVSFGLLRGRYLPSGEDVNKGIFLLEENGGVFKCELSPYITEKAKTRFLKRSAVEDCELSCWIKSIPEHPYYEITINNLGVYRSDFIDSMNRFRIQGKLISSVKGKLTIRIESNPTKNKDSIKFEGFDVIIHNCTKPLPRNKMVIVDCNFFDQKLNCLRSAELVVREPRKRDYTNKKKNGNQKKDSRSSGQKNSTVFSRPAKPKKIGNE